MNLLYPPGSVYPWGNWAKSYSHNCRTISVLGLGHHTNLESYAVSAYFQVARAGLRKIQFHDLRHTFASLLIANGEDVVRVSRLLGHSSPKITLDVYANMLPTEHYRCMDRLGELVFAPRTELSNEPVNVRGTEF